MSDVQDRKGEKIVVEHLRADVVQERSFEEIFTKNYRPVFRFFRNRGFLAEESHDLTQEVFLRVHKDFAKINGLEELESWLFTITANVWRNELRRRAAQRRDADEVSLDLEVGEGRRLEEVLDDESPDSRNPLGKALEAERRGRLRRAVFDLPTRMRQCMMLRIDQELSYHEIAEIMDVSIQTVRKQLFEGRERLKNQVMRKRHE